MEGLFIVLLTIVIPLIIGIAQSIEIDIILGIKRFSNGYFHLGVFFDEHPTEDPGFIEQELIIGLFFIDVVVIFYKEKFNA